MEKEAIEQFQTQDFITIERVVTRDFFIIPTQVVKDKSLTAVDWKVYGAILSLSRLKYGCIASNSKIAQNADMKSIYSVSRSLSKLSKLEYIYIQSDPKTKKRISIIPLIVTSKHPLPRVINYNANELNEAYHPGQNGFFIHDKEDFATYDKGFYHPRQRDLSPVINPKFPTKEHAKPSEKLIIEPKKEKLLNENGLSPVLREKYKDRIIEKDNLRSSFATGETRYRDRRDLLKNDDYQLTKNGIKKYTPPTPPTSSPQNGIEIPPDTSIPPTPKNGDISSDAGVVAAPQKNGIEISPGTGIFITPKKEGEKINDAIALFLPFFPNDFAGQNNAFTKVPTREVVGYLLERHTLAEIKDIVQKYDSYVKAGVSYFTIAYNVWDFCDKLVRIQASIARQEKSKIWERNPISTEEHRAYFDKRAKEIADEARGRLRAAKEKWAREHPGEHP